jgi:hypothetical protein
MKKVVFVVFVMFFGCGGMDPSEDIFPSEHREETIALIRRRYNAKDSEIEKAVKAEKEESLLKKWRRVPKLHPLGAASRLDLKAYRNHPRLEVDLLNTLPEELKALMRSIILSYWICDPIYKGKIRPLITRCKGEYPYERGNDFFNRRKRYELIDMPPDERREHLLWMETYWEHVKDAQEKGRVLARALPFGDHDNPAIVHGHLVLGQLLCGVVIWWTDDDGEILWDGYGYSPLLADDDVEMVSEKVIPGKRVKGDDKKEDYGFLRRIDEALKSL